MRTTANSQNSIHAGSIPIHADAIESDCNCAVQADAELDAVIGKPGIPFGIAQGVGKCVGGREDVIRKADFTKFEIRCHSESEKVILELFSGDIDKSTGPRPIP